MCAETSQVSPSFASSENIELKNMPASLRSGEAVLPSFPSPNGNDWEPNNSRSIITITYYYYIVTAWIIVNPSFLFSMFPRMVSDK